MPHVLFTHCYVCNAAWHFVKMCSIFTRIQMPTIECVTVLEHVVDVVEVAFYCWHLSVHSLNKLYKYVSGTISNCSDLFHSIYLLIRFRLCEFKLFSWKISVKSEIHSNRCVTFMFWLKKVFFFNFWLEAFR